MKKLILMFLAAILAGCNAESDSSTAENSGDGIGGSLARFSLAGDYLYTVDDQSLRILILAILRSQLFQEKNL